MRSPAVAVILWEDRLRHLSTFLFPAAEQIGCSSANEARGGTIGAAMTPMLDQSVEPISF